MQSMNGKTMSRLIGAFLTIVNTLLIVSVGIPMTTPTSFDRCCSFLIPDVTHQTRVSVANSVEKKSRFKIILNIDSDKLLHKQYITEMKKNSYQTEIKIWTTIARLPVKQPKRRRH